MSEETSRPTNSADRDPSGHEPDDDRAEAALSPDTGYEAIERFSGEVTMLPGLDSLLAVHEADGELRLVHEDGVWTIVPDGGFDDVALGRVVFTLSGDVLQRRARNGDVTHNVDVPDAERLLAIPDRSMVAVVTANREIRFFDAEDLFERTTEGFPAPPTEETRLVAGLETVAVAMESRFLWYYIDERGDVTDYGVNFDERVDAISHFEGEVVVLSDGHFHVYDAETGSHVRTTAADGVDRLTSWGRKAVYGCRPDGEYCLRLVPDGSTADVGFRGDRIVQTPNSRFVAVERASEWTVYHYDGDCDTTVETSGLSSQHRTVNASVVNRAELTREVSVSLWGEGVSVESGAIDPAAFDAPEEFDEAHRLEPLATDRFETRPGESATLVTPPVEPEPGREEVTVVAVVDGDPCSVRSLDVERSGAVLELAVRPGRVTPDGVVVRATATNTGDVSASDIEVEGPAEGVPESLAPGDSAEFECRATSETSESGPEPELAVDVTYDDGTDTRRRVTGRIDGPDGRLTVEHDVQRSDDLLAVDVRNDTGWGYRGRVEIECPQAWGVDAVGTEVTLDDGQTTRFLLPIRSPYGTITVRTHGESEFVPEVSRDLEGKPKLDLDRSLTWVSDDGKEPVRADEVRIGDTLVETLRVTNRSDRRLTDVQLRDEGEDTAYAIGDLDPRTQRQIERRHTVYHVSGSFSDVSISADDARTQTVSGGEFHGEFPEFFARAFVDRSEGRPTLFLVIQNRGDRSRRLDRVRVADETEWFSDEGLSTVEPDSQAVFRRELPPSVVAETDFPVRVATRFARSGDRLWDRDTVESKLLFAPAIDRLSQSVEIRADRVDDADGSASGGELAVGVRNVAESELAGLRVVLQYGNRTDDVDIGSLAAGDDTSFTVNETPRRRPMFITVSGSRDGSSTESTFRITGAEDGEIDVVREDADLTDPDPAAVTLPEVVSTPWLDVG